MTFAEIERLKAELTDRTVEVDPSVPELRRFQGLIGTVKTVNMNGRTLVQFDHPVDISWYDIHPTALRFVERKPKPEKVVEKGAAAPAKAPAAKPAAATSAPAATLAPAAPAAAAPAATGDKPLSKIEMARMQAKAAAAAAGTSAPAAPAATASAPVAPVAAPVAAAPAPSPGGKPLSKLEMARMQGAMKAGGAAAAPAAAPAPPPPAAAAPAKPADAAPAPQPKPAAAAPMVDESGKPLSKLEMARRQGAAKNK